MSAAEALSVDDAVALGLSCLRQAGCAGGFSVSAADGWEVKVRDGRAETVTSTTSRSLHVTVYAAEGRTGAMASGDCSPAGIRAAVGTACELAAFGDPDPWSTTAPVEESGLAQDPDIDDPDFRDFTPEQGIALVASGEQASRAADPRVCMSDYCNASASRHTSAMVSTTGVRVDNAHARSEFAVVAIAKQGEERQISWRGTSAHRWSDLRPPAIIGQEAAAKVVGKFGWKRAATGPAAVVLDRDSASVFLNLLAWSLSGDAIFRRQSWCLERLGSQLASALVSIVDDPHVLRGPGSRRCDHDGVRSRRVSVLADGRLENYLVSGYAARRLGHPYTGHSAGPSNLRLRPGSASQDDLVREAGTGLLVTDWNGWGVDLTAGTFSRGASGFAIEQGRITHPVQEVTLAGRLADLWTGVRGVGNDPDPEQGVASPCLLIDGFTIGGS